LLYPSELQPRLFARIEFLLMLGRALTMLVMLALANVAPNATDTRVVREDGIGPVKVGMTLSQLDVALRERFAMPEDKRDQGCFYVHPAKHSHVAFMIEDGRLVRIDIDAPGIPTTEGIQVGDSESKAQRIYGRRAKIEPQQYIGEGRYLTVRSNDGRYGIRFEIAKGKIQDFYAGRFAAIQYVEGCL
jgi:hypothetical protein